nr:hypothetical protein [Ferrovum sp.]
MPDELDFVSEFTNANLDAKVSAIRAQAMKIPVGNPGECVHCEEFSPRLVNGYCSPCRDQLKID